MGEDGKCFVTFGAGPEPCFSAGLCLKGNLNRKADAAPHQGNIGLDLGGRDENEVIEALFRADAAYGDNLPYSLILNSNSFAAGLLQAVGLPVPNLNQSPGWTFPLPGSVFR